MIKKYWIPLLIFFLAFAKTAAGQAIERFNSFSYNVNEGLLQSHVTDMAFDSNNFGWLSFSNGIQKFDGNRFINVPIQEGLPDDKTVAFFTTSTGDLLIAHSKGISKYDLPHDRFVQVYTNEVSNNAPALFLGEDDGQVFFFTGTGTINSISVKNFSLTSKATTGFIDYLYGQRITVKITGNISQHRIGINVDSCFYLWDLKTKQLVSKVAETIARSYFMLWLKSENEVYYLGIDKKTVVMRYNFKTGENKEVARLPIDAVSSLRSSVFSWKNNLLFSAFNVIYKTNNEFSTFTGRLVNFQNQPISGSSVIDKIKEDRFGNLYLLTVNEGIRKVISNTNPIKYFGTEKKDQNFIISVCADKKNNRILAGSYRNGLFIFDTLQQLIRHIEFLPGERNFFSPSGITKMQDGSYLIFCMGRTEVWKMSSDLKTIKLIRIENEEPGSPGIINYYSNVVFAASNQQWLHSRGMLYKTDPVSNRLKVFPVPLVEYSGCLLYQGYLLLHSGDLLYFLDTSSFKVAKTIALKNTAGVRCFEKDAAGNIYAGTNKGIFKIDSTGKVLLQIKKENGLPDECIYAMLFDKAGYLWCSTNKGLIRLYKDNIVLQLKKEDGLQENEFNSNVAEIADDGEVFFGGVNGVSSFFPSVINNTEENINIIFTRIRINNNDFPKDTSISGIQTIDLPYNQNYLAFDFVAMASNNPGQYIHQYKMDGVDDQWIQNNELQTVRYYLPPGKYVFKVTASRFFDKEAKPIKEITIIIHPPFWETWWFFSGLAALFIFISVFTVNRYNKRKYTKKLMELEGEHKIQLERERISRDLHDSIGAYANAVLYKTDLLQKQKDNDGRGKLMQDLKFASKDIITSLRETVWALKKEKYTAQECVLRMRNFVQPFNRYYEHIHFTVAGEAPADMELHYTRALNLVRIVQEAVSNSIKHAQAGNITVTSSIEKAGWKIMVTDDGAGFDYDRINELQQGNGLNNMRKRSMDAGFQLTVNSLAEKGTSISVLVIW